MRRQRATAWGIAFAVALGLAGWWGAPAAFAREMAIVTPPAAFALIGPDRQAGSGQLDLYAQTGPRPNWFIGQWQIAGGKLPAFRRMATPSGGTAFVSRNEAASVVIVQNGPEIGVTLSQNGPTQPCTTPTGRPHEFDLFVNTGGPWVHPALASALSAPPQGGNAPSLAQMARLDQHVSVHIAQPVPSGPGRGCKVNQGNVLTAVTLVNDDVQPAQVLFYQVSLHVVCGGGATAHAACERNLSRPFQWWTGMEGRDTRGRVTKLSFGFDQRLPGLGRPFLPAGGRQDVDIDLLPDLLRLIAAGAHGMDRDPAHWRVSGAYHGESVWGDVSLHTQWSDYRLTAQLR